MSEFLQQNKLGGFGVKYFNISIVFVYILNFFSFSMIYFASQADLKSECRSFYNDLWTSVDGDSTSFTVDWDKFNNVSSKQQLYLYVFLFFCFVVVTFLYFFIIFIFHLLSVSQ